MARPAQVSVGEEVCNPRAGRPRPPGVPGVLNPLLVLFPIRIPNPIFFFGGTVHAERVLARGYTGLAPTATLRPRQARAGGRRAAPEPAEAGGPRGGGRPAGSGAKGRGRVGRAHSPPRDPVEQHAGRGASGDSQAAGQARRGAAGQQRAHSFHGSTRRLRAAAEPNAECRTRGGGARLLAP